MSSNAHYFDTKYNHEDFAGYLHNPYGYPLEIEKKAIERLSNIIDMNGYLRFVLSDYFGDAKKLQQNGLTQHYIALKDYIIENKLIGLIYWGADGSREEIKTEITQYTTLNNTTISLTIHSICNYLIKEFIKPENVEELCRASLL
tara:strand:- start:1262 stop:1696 length:435 start_codon:yes stop_codon:yes gene_type:complete